MSKYELFKSSAKAARKKSNPRNLPLMQYMDECAKSFGFTNLHDVKQVSRRNHVDRRLTIGLLSMCPLHTLIRELGVSVVLDMLNVSKEDMTEWLVEEHNYNVLDRFLDGDMSGYVAETNASMFGIEDLYCEDITYDVEERHFILGCTFSYSGEQDEDRINCGSSFSVSLNVKVSIDIPTRVWSFIDEIPFDIISIENDLDIMIQAEHEAETTLQREPSTKSGALKGELKHLHFLLYKEGGKTDRYVSLCVNSITGEHYIKFEVSSNNQYGEHFSHIELLNDARKKHPEYYRQSIKFLNNQ
ncbi:hypothetical protein [Shewanella sp. NKUCC06_TVS]|uniref:hypothetical protein n=1 Tax=Shewanella sp. NKUCC06_TVS TaxID=2842128 RepID=UPI001C5B0973|nr:hypothetical protein [Shewanella sp. NKUCC06_TVS]MBW3532987.1 hypothetical protein [Shewanella sp. NKUCC06_TVS]